MEPSKWWLVEKIFTKVVSMAFHFMGKKTEGVMMCIADLLILKQKMLNAKFMQLSLIHI